MLRIVVPAREWLNEKTNEFIGTTRDTELLLEHSLLSVSKWEAKWKKAFFNENKTEEKTFEEQIDYVRCMTVNGGVDPMVYYSLTPKNRQDIQDYINDPMSATTVYHRKTKKRVVKKKVTSEVIYAEMIQFGIPFECQKWHLNRLIKLIDVCSVNNGPTDKMSQKEILKENAALNAMRKSKLHTKG